MTLTQIDRNFSIDLGGDIFAEPTDDLHTAVGHGVNLFGVMGGFAALIDTKFPDDAAAYRAHCPFDIDMIGSVTEQEVSLLEPENGLRLGDALVTGESLDSRLWVAHIASQARPGPDARVLALYQGVLSAARTLGEDGNIAVLRVPLIGGGIGGIDPAVAAHTIRLAAHAADDIANVEVILYLRDADPTTTAVLEYIDSIGR